MEPADFLVFDDSDSFKGHHLASLWDISLYDIFVINTLDYTIGRGHLSFKRPYALFCGKSKLPCGQQCLRPPVVSSHCPH